jgi:hypothetical protein
LSTDVNMPGTICIQRRQVLQDLLRRYTVLIDGVSVGKLAALRTGRYAVSSGCHSVQLRFGAAGISRSDVLAVDVASGETRVVRTARQSLRNILFLPLHFFNPYRFLPRPWIRLHLEDRN